MDKKTGKLEQGDSDFIKFFFDLFYRPYLNLNEKWKDNFMTLDENLLPKSKTISVLICGAGSCIHELPVLLTLFESKQYEKITLTFVDKAEEPFKLLDFILQKYEEYKIGKEEIASYFENPQIPASTNNTICNNRIEYFFHVMDLELDPHEFVKDSESNSHENTTNRYTEFNFFNDKEYDIVMMSMFLQHISYWRSLIAFLNEHLKDGGYFWFNELGKDDNLLTLDLYMAIIDNKRKRKDWKHTESLIIEYFENEYYNRDKDQMIFSIISDNDEISPTNTEICRDFFDFFGSKGEIIFKENFQSDIIPSELFKNAKVKFSPFTKLHSLIEDDTLSPTFSDNIHDELDFCMTWYAYPRVTDKNIKHFNVFDETAEPIDIPVLQQYINRTLDILNLNSTIFRPTFLRKEASSKKMLESASHLFRRFQLFKIGKFHSIVFYIPDIIIVECFKDTKENYEDNFTEQQKFIKENIRPYNDNRKIWSGDGSNSGYFFDKYKTKMTKPFSIFYEPLDCYTNETVSWENIGFDINEYGLSPNRKVHIIRVEGKQTDSQTETTLYTPLGVSYSQSSLRNWYNIYHQHFKGYRTIFIPCFREPLFDKNKEFLGDLIMTQDVSSQKETLIDGTSIEFFSWLIRKFIDFTQIATYLDYKRIIRQSIKSAKAAIMSRNMSHNLGSHVMAYLKQQLGSVTSIMNGEKVLANLPDVVEGWKQTNLKAIELPFLVGLGKFIGYLQERQDYIATIATDYIPYGAPVNMKDAIYDELNPDLRHLRHNSSDDEKDQNRPDNILLSYIAKSEGLSRENMKISGGINKIDTSHDILFGYVQYGNRDQDEAHIFGLVPMNSSSADPALTEMRKINFSLPGGLVGRQAVFSIIENIIRNASKHGDTSNVKNLEFVFDIIDGAELKDKKVVRVGDRITDEVNYQLYCLSNDINSLYLLSITDNLQYEETVTDLLREGLKEPFVDFDGHMSTNNKGIKEIRISAAWLRNNVDEESYAQYPDKSNQLKLEAPDKNYQLKLKAPLVAIEITPEKHLRYIIGITKNNYVAVIKDGMQPEDYRNFDVLHRSEPMNWCILDRQQFLSNCKISYCYVIVANQSIYKEIRPKYSNRIIIWNPREEIASLIDSKWEKYKNYSFNKDSIEIMLDDPNYNQCVNAMLSDTESLNVIKSKINTNIFQLFSGFQEELAVPIYIWDDKTYQEYEKKKEEAFPLIRYFDSEEEQEKAQYAYRKHHSNDKDFRAFYENKSVNGKYIHIKSVDAITGDNSSDRLVRREPLNEEWYYSHLRALQKKVAVFDERIFKYVHNIDERSFIVGSQSVSEVIDGLSNNSISVDEAMKKINNRELLISLQLRNTLNKLFDKGELDIKMLCDKISNYSRFCKPQDSFGNHLSAFYSEKQVDVFTIIKERNRKYAIVGCVEHGWRDNNFRCHFDKIGCIYFSTSGKMDVEVNEDFKNRYDYITIHQGLLDKIYDEFGFKSHSDENNKKKCLTTEKIYKAFMKDAGENIIQNENQGYLPCFIIHSGRAKPSVEDMPQKLPFIQFAAIENAVKDCKYSLIQLLDYARYEESN